MAENLMSYEIMDDYRKTVLIFDGVRTASMLKATVDNMMRFYIVGNFCLAK